MRVLVVIISVLLCSCANRADIDSVVQKDFTRYVNPLIGTSRMGHLYPGATVPFGMVQLSPQTGFQPFYNKDGLYNKAAYGYCAGYRYEDSIILGFAHTNFSGTGHSDLGDFLIMPTVGSLVTDPLLTPDGSKGFYSVFSHETETALPGYYAVELDSYGVKAELTATERVGFHRYTFPKTDSAHLVLDLIYNVYHHDEKNVWTFIRVENDSLVTGYRQTTGWARTRKVFFAMQFSKPFKSYGFKKYDKNRYKGFYRYFNQQHDFPEMAGRNIRAYFNFGTRDSDVLMVKLALSPVSTHGAIKNLKAEIPHWDFNRVREQARAKWNRELSKIEVETLTDSDKVAFYTALYHTCLSPILYEDVDGCYRGLDQNIHQSEGFVNYTIFSLWDTYRALHPLFNLIQPDRNNNMIKSMLAHYNQSVHGMLPVWSHYANENWCMIGYHAVSVIADAIAKGVGDFDYSRALAAAVSTANVPYFGGLADYTTYGYVPADKHTSSVSKTLEYAYDDWCISRIAAVAGDTVAENTFLHRAQSYVNVYDSATGFMRPRLSNGSFRADFDPMDTHGQGFIEGNAWNYGLYVPHCIEHMVDMMGGKVRFRNLLDSLFSMTIADRYIEKHEDITRDGIIGAYVHGNEPGHHIPYLYNWTDSPFRTQSRVRMILDTMYGVTPDGLCGNDDAGQMSAWYIFSALGFYPILPGSDWYAVGSPLVKRAVLHLENGKSLTIVAHNQSNKNVYVKRLCINGTPVYDFKISHSDIMQGGSIVFEMDSVPGVYTEK